MMALPMNDPSAQANMGVERSKDDMSAVPVALVADRACAGTR